MDGTDKVMMADMVRVCILTLGVDWANIIKIKPWRAAAYCNNEFRVIGFFETPEQGEDGERHPECRSGGRKGDFCMARVENKQAMSDACSSLI